jgi:hypothetical protein
MSAHTPGPWDVTTMSGQAVSPRDGFFVSATDSLGVRTDIAIIRPCVTHGPAELGANAALVSAAPELLAALERLAEYETEGERYRFAIRPDDMAVLRAAIAKARGES